MVRKQGIDTEFPFDEAGSTMAEVTKEDTDVSETERKAEVSPPKLSAEGNAEETYSGPPAENGKSEDTNAASGLDMRSIHDFPPDPPQMEETKTFRDALFEPKEKTDIKEGKEAYDIFEFAKRLMSAKESGQRPEPSLRKEEEKKEKDTNELTDEIDSSWDTSNPVFSERLNTEEKSEMNSDAVDLFDITSWGDNGAGFSDVSLSMLAEDPDIEAQFLRQMYEDMRKKYVELTDEQQEIMRNVEKTLGISVNSDESEAACSKSCDMSEKEAVPNDDEPLLTSRTTSSDENDTEATDRIVSIEQRIERYTAPNELDEESSVEEGTDDEGDDEEVKVEYVTQLSDDEAENDEVSQGNLPNYNQETVLVDEVPGFDIAADAALKSELNQTSSDSVEAAKDTKESLGADSLTPRMLSTHGTPRAPSSLSLSKKTESKSNSGATGEIPLIPPPPKEKMEKFEKLLLRAQRPLESKTDLQKVDSQQLGTNNEIEGPPKLNRKNMGEAEPNIFSTPEKAKTAKTFGEKESSPSGGEPILTDNKMAEKVALISSAAADKFEERLQQRTACPGSPSSQGSKDSTQSPIVFSCSYDLASFSPDLGDNEVSPIRGENAVVTDLGLNQTRSTRSPTSEASVELVGGAFSSWEPADFERKEGIPKSNLEDSDSGLKEIVKTSEELLSWFCEIVLDIDFVVSDSDEDLSVVARQLLEKEVNFNAMCQHVADCVNKVTSELGMAEELTVGSLEELAMSGDGSSAGNEMDLSLNNKRPWLKPTVLSESSKELSPNLIAANFASFIYLASKLAEVQSPFGHQNPVLTKVTGKDSHGDLVSPQHLIFEQVGADELVCFVREVTNSSEAQIKTGKVKGKGTPSFSTDGLSDLKIDPISRSNHATTPSVGNRRKKYSRLLIVPDGHPSPFEASVTSAPRVVAAILSFLGDPVAVCRMKMVNRFCCRIVSENEHMLMQDAVRTGGMSMNVRPAFWMWITLQKFSNGTKSESQSPIDATIDKREELQELDRCGKEGKWNNVIERDVARSFGNMPPHKTGARLRNDSIVRALVMWGQNRIMKRGVRGGGDPMPTPELGPKETRKRRDVRRQTSFSSPPWECPGIAGKIVENDSNETPTDTVSDWGAVTPVGSFAGSTSGFVDGDNASYILSRQGSSSGKALPVEELALSGNSLTSDMKVKLQNKLSFILHCLAATYEDVGYCQGMDYVVAHLLRILQDTIRWKALQGTLPPGITTASTIPDITILQDKDANHIKEEIDRSFVVEEAVFRVMDTFFTTYNLRHMYWPELRCLKTCCRVFERLIQIKLPVLADHFEHHDLNVGLFALGWFQTLFLYLPSMPSATVCHMWDIWLVERSFKIFFRVGTAILFLSQPILLNYELEGMMTYLNTIPDATLLRPDILIACALNIKVTNRMLQELETEVTREQ